MNEELRAIRAQEALADSVYDDFYGTSSDEDDEDWFLSELQRISEMKKETP